MSVSKSKKVATIATTAIRMIVLRKMLMLLLLTVVKCDPLLHNSCDTACVCDSHSVVCKGRQLDNIPNDLNPYITRLDVGTNKIKYVSNMEAYNR